MRFELAEKMGMRGEWVRLLGTWNGKEYEYLQDDGDGVWRPHKEGEVNVVTIKYVGGPKDGTVEW